MYSSYKKQQIIAENWRRYLKEEAPAITHMHAEVEDYKKRGCKWNYQIPGIKVFFDITSFSHENQSFFGKAIIVGNAIQKALQGQIEGAMGAANHVGFIFSDGSIFHATTDESGPGVSFQPSIPDMEENPHQYVILYLDGSETNLRRVCENILQELSQHVEPTQAYDKKGIARQVPLLGKLLAHLPITKEENEYSFYCSELVANALARVGFIKPEELKAKMLNEQLGTLDELSPTELYELLAPDAYIPDNAIRCQIPKSEQASPQQDTQSPV